MRGFRSGPPHLARRLVASGDIVYATLGYGAPVTALKGATGEVVRAYTGTEGTEEIVLDDGVLFVAVGDPEAQRARDEATRRGESLPMVEKRIMALLTLS